MCGHLAAAATDSFGVSLCLGSSMNCTLRPIIPECMSSLHWSLVYAVLCPGLDSQVHVISMLEAGLVMVASGRRQGGDGMEPSIHSAGLLSVLLSLRETGKEKQLCDEE